MTTAAKSIKDMLGDLNVFYDTQSMQEKTFYKNIRYQILKSVLAYHWASRGDNGSTNEMEEIYKKIAESYKNSMKTIKDIAKNPSINSNITTIAINDMHLVKSFSKSLRNALLMPQGE